MKYPAGTPSTMFCEQVSTVTSLFEHWNDCEQTVVLYALLKRVPFVNLKFLQLSIDYNLMQNYSTQTKLQMLENKANNTVLLTKLIKKYYQLGGRMALANANLNNNNASNVNFNIKTTTDAHAFESETKCTTTTGSSCSAAGYELGSTSSSSSSSSSISPNCTSSMNGIKGQHPQQLHLQREPETKEDILKDILMYLPLLTPGSEDAKTVYMKLVPAAVEDACQQLVATELVQQILSYLLIHPAITNDDRRFLSQWLRHLEDYISTSYVPATVPIKAQRNYMTLTTNTVSGNGNNPFLVTTAGSGGGGHWQQRNGSNSNQPHSAHSSTHSLNQPQKQQPMSLSKSQQNLNQTNSSNSSSSSSSCLDSAASQLLKAAPAGQLDWTTAPEDVDAANDFTKTIGKNLLVSSQATTAATHGGSNCSSVSVGNGKSTGGGTIPNGPPPTVPPPVTANPSAAAAAAAAAAVTTNSVGGMNLSMRRSSSSPFSHNANGGDTSGGTVDTHDLIGATTESLLYDSCDDHHISFSKNGTEIFDFDCDFGNEDEFSYLARSAAANARTAATATTNGKKLVSFNNTVSDFLRVPQNYNSHAYGLDLGLDGGLLKTRRSNSLTTPTASALSVDGDLQHQQRQYNECLSAENLTNLELLQNKQRSFSLSMESPRSSLTSSGSETRLDDFKQHSMLKLYGGAQPNLGMSSIGHWLKSLRLHKYVWLFSNLTYEQMMDITEEYLQSLGVTKGARHKLVLCILKLKDRHDTLLQLEKDLTGGQNAQLGAILEEMTNIVLTPMKPIGMDQKEDIAGQFAKVLDLVGSILLMRPMCNQQDEEYLNMFVWILDRALHNDAFIAHSNQIKEHKYKSSKIKMQLTPKGHFVKNPIVNGGGINKPRWTATTKHSKPNGGLSEIQPKPHRKNSIQYFAPPLHPLMQQQQQQQPQSQSQSHLQTSIQQYYHHTSGNGGGGGSGGGCSTSGISYNKSSSYPSFASTLASGLGNVDGCMKATGQQQAATTTHPQSAQLQQQQQQQSQQQQQQQQPPSSSHPPPNFMYHRHSLNNITAHPPPSQHGQATLLPSIFLANLSAIPVPPPPVTTDTNSSSSNGNTSKAVPPPQSSCSNIAVVPPPSAASTAASVSSSVTAPPMVSCGLGVSLDGSGAALLSGRHNSSIGDINSRLEFLCRQMTEQAIN